MHSNNQEVEDLFLDYQSVMVPDETEEARRELQSQGIRIVDLATLTFSEPKSELEIAADLLLQY